jgi:beta-galactosidase
MRKYDPTRPVTMACDNTNSALWRHFDFYDVHSWNYGRRYSMARQMEPNKGVIVSESGSTVSTRGYYELPLPVKRDGFSNTRQISSYDLNVPFWADLPDEDFMWQQDEEYIAGEFVWTGFDYLGEPTPYTNDWAKGNGLTDKEASRSSYFGIVDLCGIPKDRYFLYKSYWKPEETTVHILPHWNWEGANVKNVPVFVYTNGDCAELFLNGKSLGKRCKNPTSEKSIERFRLMWNDVNYEPGELKAVAYREGEVIGESVLRTAGEPVGIRLTPDRTTLHADGMDLSYLLVEAVDKDGNVCPLASDKVNITIDGPGRIAGVGNGNPQSFDPFQANYVNLFNGKAIIIIGSGFDKGTVNISAASGNMKKDTRQININ